MCCGINTHRYMIIHAHKHKTHSNTSHKQITHNLFNTYMYVACAYITHMVCTRVHMCVVLHVHVICFCNYTLQVNTCYMQNRLQVNTRKTHTKWYNTYAINTCTFLSVDKCTDIPLFFGAVFAAFTNSALYFSISSSA